MGRILVRNVEDAVLDALRRRAVDSGVSLEEETRRALAASVGIFKSEALARADAFRARVASAPGQSALDDLRADRARDSAS